MADVGRPTVMTDETIHKLEEAFSWDCSDLEACFYANIGKSTFYNYVKAHPEFQDRIDELRKSPLIRARRTIINSLDDVKTAEWYMEKKNAKEFSGIEKHEISGSNGNPILLNILEGPLYASEPEHDNKETETTAGGPEEQKV